jgi:hypothetical protein
LKLPLAVLANHRSGKSLRSVALFESSARLFSLPKKYA